jgi:hypothetical protein
VAVDLSRGKCAGAFKFITLIHAAFEKLIFCVIELIHYRDVILMAVLVVVPAANGYKWFVGLCHGFVYFD